VTHYQNNLKMKLDMFPEVCRQAGLKATKQRREIYREVISTLDHPDAEKIWKGVRKRCPRISLDTVYRTLYALETIGLISRVGIKTERFRFDGNTTQHHHFVCTSCGLIRDIVSPELDATTPPAAVEQYGEVTSVQTELKGVCHDCLARKKT
jgi:Fur family peroxide stress response transcriptional regulator